MVAVEWSQRRATLVGGGGLGWVEGTSEEMEIGLNCCLATHVQNLKRFSAPIVFITEVKLYFFICCGIWLINEQVSAPQRVFMPSLFECDATYVFGFVQNAILYIPAEEDAWLFQQQDLFPLHMRIGCNIRADKRTTSATKQTEHAPLIRQVNHSRFLKYQRTADLIESHHTLPRLQTVSGKSCLLSKKLARLQIVAHVCIRERARDQAYKEKGETELLGHSLHSNLGHAKQTLRQRRAGT